MQQFNWGSHDKHAVKIRDLNPQYAVEVLPSKRKNEIYPTLLQPTKEETAKFDYDKYQ